MPSIRERITAQNEHRGARHGLARARNALLYGGADQAVKAREQVHKPRLGDALAKDRAHTTRMLVEMQRRLARGESPEALSALVDEGTPHEDGGDSGAAPTTSAAPP